jgi:DNA modification methylase
MVEIGKLKPNPANPNQHPPKQVTILARMIEADGFRHPIVVSKRSGLIVSGHGRYLAAKALGMKKVPVDRQAFKSAEQEKAVLLSDNMIAELAEMDFDAAGEILKLLTDADYDMELTGIEEDEISRILDELNADEPRDDDDVIPPTPEKPTSKIGDLWLLGEHRVLCGDATKAEDVERLMDGKKADMVFTDPPYGIDYLPTSGLKRLGRLASDKKYPEGYKAFSEWLESVLSSIFGTMKKGCVYYFWMSWQYIGTVERVLRDKGCYANNFIVWNRELPRLTPYPQDFLPVAELCLYGWKRGGKKRNNNPKDAMRTNVWSVARLKAEDMIHTTEKPVALGVNALRMSSRNNDIVVDAFLGSGSTLIACEKLNRISYGLEIEPRYVDVIVKRWEDYTGKKAQLQKTKKKTRKRKDRT